MLLVLSVCTRCRRRSLYHLLFDVTYLVEFSIRNQPFHDNSPVAICSMMLVSELAIRERFQLTLKVSVNVLFVICLEAKYVCWRVLNLMCIKTANEIEGRTTKTLLLLVAPTHMFIYYASMNYDPAT